MIGPRWAKIRRDLWGNKLRTLLVVLSIAVGVFAVGVVTQTFTTVQNELVVNYPKSNPAHAVIYPGNFDDDLVTAVRHMDGVKDVQGRATTIGKIRIAGEEWKQVRLFMIPDFNAISINKLIPQTTFPPDATIGAERGVWPPPERGLLFERASFLVPGLVPPGLKVGDSVEIEMLTGKRYSLKFAGLAHDISQLPPTFVSAAYAYITPDTYEWLTGSRRMDELDLVIDQAHPTKADVTQVAERIQAKLETTGRQVYITVSEPGKHPLLDLFQGLLLILNALGLSALVLSGFLIVNTVNGLLAQQVRQIGMMKAIGARRGQLIGMYMAMLFVYGMLAFFVAAPAAAYMSGWTAQLLAGFINVDFPSLSVSPSVLVLEAVIALVFPLLAGIFPVIGGTRLTVRQAVSDYGIGQAAKPGLIDRALELARGLPRPLMLSLRNTFRRKMRLALTLTTLVLGGAIFIAVFSLRSTMLLTLDDALKYWQFDVLLQFPRVYRTDLIQSQVAQIPGIVHAETWGINTARRVRADDTQSDDITVFAVEPATQMLQPTIIEGRWLEPGDENAMVVSNRIVAVEKDLKVGSDVTLKINGKKTQWHIVGLARVVGNFGSGFGTVYTPYDYYARTTGEVGRAGTVQVTTDKHDAAYEDQIMKAMEEQFKAAGMRTAGGITNGMLRQQNELFFNILIVLLLVMAILMAAVGGLGLMGTMSLNVLERTREIGVMRAIGASNGAIQNIVLVEGVLIGLLSWALGAALSIPLGQLLSEALGTIIFEMPLHYVTSFGGMLIWLVVVTVISAVASVLPALNAARLTVRQVLAYE